MNKEFGVFCGEEDGAAFYIYEFPDRYSNAK
jgi:hypothetical protein